MLLTSKGSTRYFFWARFLKFQFLSWIGTAYLLTSTVFLPFFAVSFMYILPVTINLPLQSVADIYGRHFGLQSAILLFIFGSALSTGARSMTMMIGGRAVAGIGGAGMLTVSIRAPHTRPQVNVHSTSSFVR